ncbi:TPA: hypothetical protein ACPSKE_001663 [Legionella feeleii]
MKFLIKSIDDSEFELSLDDKSTILDLKSQIVDYYKKKFTDQCTVEDINDLRVLFNRKALLNNHVSLGQLFDSKETNLLYLIVPKRHRDQRYISKEISEFFSDKITSDLNLVGIKKTLGYLTTQEIVEGGYNIEELKSAFRQKGITTYINESKGFFYAYDKPSLQALLNSNLTCLEKNGWPGDVDEFVRQVCEVTATEPGLWNLIHRAFTDASCVLLTSTLTISETSPINLLIRSQTSSGLLALQDDEEVAPEKMGTVTPSSLYA